MIRQAFVLGVNPEPWKVPPFTPARRGGKMIVISGRDETGHLTKESIRAELIDQGADLLPPPYRLHFYFWRHLEQYKTAKGRNMTRRRADATNMQKLTEDALQGVLIDNDVNVRMVSSQWVRQAKDIPGMMLLLIEAGDDGNKFDEPIIPPDFDSATLRSALAAAMNDPGPAGGFPAVDQGEIPF